LYDIILNDMEGWRTNPYFEFNKHSLYLRHMPFFGRYPVEFYQAVYNTLSIQGKINYLVNEHVYIEKLLNDDIEYL
jgi:hypothetical protein